MNPEVWTPAPAAYTFNIRTEIITNTILVVPYYNLVDWGPKPYSNFSAPVLYPSTFRLCAEEIARRASRTPEREHS